MNKASPLISICIPVYNTIDFIEETISCFINQSYTNWELIIQDDCSNDGTWELLLEKYQHTERIYIFKNETNLGIGRNWNEAYQRTKGEYVVMFNADDLVIPEFLRESLAFFKMYPEVDLIINPYLKSDELDNKSSVIPLLRSQIGLTKDIINVNKKPNYRLHWNFTLAKKESLEKLKNVYGLFYPTQVCDAMLWYEAYSHQLKAFYTGKVVGVYRLHESNNSKIPLGEFESTLLWMIPIYPDLYSKKINRVFYSKFILLYKYLYACSKYGKKPKMRALFNIFKYV